jgi:SPP1 family predicted phage head-tail adaptor
MRAGALRYTVQLANPGPAVTNGDGGFTQVPVPLEPSTVFAAIHPASARDLERIRAGSVIATATHVVTMRYHPGVTTKTQLTFNGRTFNVVGLSNTDERNIELICLCVEVVA